MDHSDKSVSHFGMRKCVYSSLKHEVSIQAHQKKYIRLRVFTDIVIKYFNPRCPFFAPQAVSELSTCGFLLLLRFVPCLAAGLVSARRVRGRPLPPLNNFQGVPRPFLCTGTSSDSLSVVYDIKQTCINNITREQFTSCVCYIFSRQCNRVYL